MFRSTSPRSFVQGAIRRFFDEELGLARESCIGSSIFPGARGRGYLSRGRGGGPRRGGDQRRGGGQRLGGDRCRDGDQRRDGGQRRGVEQRRGGSRGRSEGRRDQPSLLSNGDDVSRGAIPRRPRGSSGSAPRGRMSHGAVENNGGRRGGMMPRRGRHEVPQHPQSGGRAERRGRSARRLFTSGNEERDERPSCRVERGRSNEARPMEAEAVQVVRDVILRSGLDPQSSEMEAILADIAAGAYVSWRVVTPTPDADWGLPVDGWSDDLPLPAPAMQALDMSLGLRPVEVPGDGSSVSGDSSDGGAIGLANLPEVVGDIAERDRDLAVLDLFLCPLCCGLIYPTYKQCRGFHVLCNSCLEKVEGGCPYCRRRKPHRRNHRMEEFAARYRFPCLHKVNGCAMYLGGGEWDEHVSGCSFAP